MNGSIIIPERFRLNGKIIRVIIDNEWCVENECSGEADFTQKIITLANRMYNINLRKKEREQTFYHELVHMILDSMERHNLKYNEDFVEEFGRRLYEFEKTKQ